MAAKCYNRNNKGYQILLEKYDNPLAVDSLISGWQVQNETDAYPSVSEAEQFSINQKAYYSLKKRDFGKVLLANLSREKLITKRTSSGKYYVNVTTPESRTWSRDGAKQHVRKNIERINRYLGYNYFTPETIIFEPTRNWSNPKEIGTFEVKVNNSLFTNQDTIEKSRANDSVHGMQIIRHLSKMFPQVKIAIATEEEAKEHLKNLPESVRGKVPFKDVKSYFHRGTAVLIKGRVNTETTIEELLTPFVNALAVENTSLFNNLHNEASKMFPVLKQEITDAYSDLRGFNNTDRKLELVTQALTRHFKKEYEETPTLNWKQKILQLLDWLKTIVNDLHAYINGKNIPVSKLRKTKVNSNTTLTDIAKLLNTEGLSFRMDQRAVSGGRKVQYSLSTDAGNILTKAMAGANPIQTDVIGRMFSMGLAYKSEIAGLPAGRRLQGQDGPLVVFEEEGHKYFDINSENIDEYKSATLSIKGEMKDQEEKALNLALGNDFDIIAGGLAAMLPFEEIAGKMKILNTKLAERAYYQLEGTFNSIRQGGSIIIPQVILYDQGTKRAGQADIIVIDPLGEIGVIDIKSGKAPIGTRNYDQKAFPVNEGSDLIEFLKSNDQEGITTKTQHGIQIGLYRRMLQNMGYRLMDHHRLGAYASIYFNVDVTGKNKAQKFNGDFKFEGWQNHLPSANLPYIDALIPLDVSVLSVEQMDEMMENADVDNPMKDPTFLDDEQAIPEDQYEELDTAMSVIFGRMDAYQVGLVKRKEAYERMKQDVFMDKTTGELIEQIAKTTNAILASYEQGFSAVDAVYTQLLIDSIREIDSFKKYIEDPANFGKPEFITYVMNMSEFVETYRGLYSVGEHAPLNNTQKTLILKLTDKLNKVVGNASTNDLGIINQAVYDYVHNLVGVDGQGMSNEIMTKEEVDRLLTKVQDISAYEFQTYDTATSSDKLIQLMDKLTKRGRQEVSDRVETRNNELRSVARRLAKLSPGGKVDYSFAMQLDDEGKWNGEYLQELGSQYSKLRQEKYDLIYDEFGNPLEYIVIDDIETAKEKDIEHNIRVWRAKKEFSEFMRAEERSGKGFKDGEYHKYTDEFKTARAMYEEYVAVGDYGHWRKKTGVAPEAHQRFKLKYFDKRTANFAQYDGVGNPTGMFSLDVIEVPKVKYRVARTVTSKGQSMKDPKWIKIMNPTNALEEAQKLWFLTFKRHFEDELLTKLSPGVRHQMLGKAPLVFGNMVDTVKEKGNLVANMWSRTKQSWDEFWSETGTSKKVMTDQDGNFIDTVPVYYVGKPRNDKHVASIDKKLDELKQNYNLGKIKLDQYKEQKVDLDLKRSQVMSMPTVSEISTDLTDSLLRFSAMAENYEVMTGIEDTLNAIINVAEKREYVPSNDMKLYGKVKGKLTDVGMRGVGKGGEQLVVQRMKKFMKMIFYDSEHQTRKWHDKVVDGVIRYSSLSYVAFNPFGNINNYVIGSINNQIEVAGARFFNRAAYARATAEFVKRAIPDMVRATAFSGSKEAYKKYVPQSKYEAMVAHYRMMDKKADIREVEQLNKKESWLNRKLNWGYMLQDAAEYNVQTRVGMAMLMTKQIKNSKTGETLSLYDAYNMNGDGTVSMKDGYDTLIDDKGKSLGEWNESTKRHDLRNEIREVNKQIHGNYAREDRMAMQSYTIGKLAAQFHKWVIPAIKARYRREYFDENVGWLEGRYMSMFAFSKYALTHIGEVNKWATEFQKQHGGGERARMKMLNVYRSLGELALMITTYLTFTVLMGLFEDDDDDSDFRKKVENALIYQADRANKELLMFFPFVPAGFTQIYQMFKSPIPSTRTLGELAEAMDAGITYATAGGFAHDLGFISDDEFWTNSDLVYTRGSKKNTIKVAKQWRDAVPILYGIQRWNNFLDQKDFFIK